MLLLEPFSAILLTVAFSICVKAETHTIVLTNKCVVFLDLSLDPLSLTRELVAALELYVTNVLLNGMAVFNLFSFSRRLSKAPLAAY